MNLEELFRLTVEKLSQRGVTYALAGGMAASLYRKQPRLTADLDFLLYADANEESVAKEIIESFGLTPREARKAQLEGGPMFAIKRNSTPVCIIVGRNSKEESEPGLDFILPQMPWFKKALERAQSNRIDFGFETIPCLTPEDMIVSKLYSLRNSATRTDDLSDLRSIFENLKDMDIAYIASRMQELSLLLPLSFEKEAPLELKKASKNVAKEIRRKIQKF